MTRKILDVDTAEDFDAQVSRVKRETDNLYAKLVRRGDILMLSGRPFCAICGVDIEDHRHGVSHYVSHSD